MISSYSFDREIYVDNLKISNYDDYSFDKEVYVDNLKIYNYDCQILF